MTTAMIERIEDNDFRHIHEIIVNSLPVGFSRVDQNGTIREFNPAAEKITGYRKEEVLRTSHLNIIHGSSDPEACPLFTHAFKERTYSVATETEIVRKTGETINLAVTTAPLFDAAGDFIGGVELFRDITELKRVERERKNFLAMIAHDMKNPVIVAGGFLNRLAAGKVGPITEKQEEYFKLILEEIKKVKSLLSDLLEFSKLERDQYTPDSVPYDIEKALRKQVEHFKVQAENKNIAVQIELPKKGLSVIKADPSMVDRVVTNLLNNAVKYTDSGGSVNLRAFAREEDLLIEISDTGSGIAAEDLPFIFDAFYKARRGPKGKRAKGTGLGLHICKKMVEAHGGNIAVESTRGEGTTFRFTLPKN
jgi:two-component system phosphate regulon sensor histidine kinase PhoR